jgi:hypothetical protein
LVALDGHFPWSPSCTCNRGRFQCEIFAEINL